MTAPEPRSRLRIGIGAAVVLVLVALACAVLFSATAPRGSTATVPSPAPTSVSARSSSGATTGTIFVHILGEVKSPGLYELKDGARAVDVVAAAGGFTAKADQASVNLARFLTDGEQIVVPVVGAVPTAGAAPAAGAGGGANAAGAKVDLNTADEATLETLPRVGPAMAARILAWRAKNGRFTSIEDLKSVSGIGDKTFADLKDLVTV